MVVVMVMVVVVVMVVVIVVAWVVVRIVKAQCLLEEKGRPANALPPVPRLSSQRNVPAKSPGELCFAARRASEVSSGVGPPYRDSQALEHLPLHNRCLPPLPHSCGSRKLFPD